MKLPDNVKGKEYWRSLDQLANTPEFQNYLKNEFPENASEISEPVSRRKFLTLMGASLAFAGLAACRRPVEKIVPYVTAPENVVLGKPLYYATVMPRGLSAYGLVVESHEGRPTKIEGNIDHPSSLGKASAQIQASILDLYDPDRSYSVLENGQEKEWADFVSFWAEMFKKYQGVKGEGLAVLSGSFSSPTLYALHREFKKVFPKARWIAYDPVSEENLFSGLQLVFNAPVRPIYAFDKAKVILSLESDFLYEEEENLTAMKGFASGRRVQSEKDEMNRLYVVENIFTTTGGMADHRLRLQSRQIAPFAFALAEEMMRQGVDLGLPRGRLEYTNTAFDQKWISAVVRDLIRNRGRSLVVAGSRQPASVHALCALMNRALKNEGNTVRYAPVKDALVASLRDMVALADSMEKGEVETLVMLGGNPVYNAPADLDFGEKIKNVKTTIHFSSHVDETSKQVQWHVPLAHYLESWGDVRAADGTVSVVQPLISPLFDGVSDVQVAHLIVRGKDAKPYDVVRETFKKNFGGTDFEARWRKALNKGVVEGTKARTAKLFIRPEALVAHLQENPLPRTRAGASNLEVVFRASPALYDGRYANNGWLQEMPDPVSKLTWDNPILMSPATAEALGFKNEDVVRLSYAGRTVQAPVWIAPGHADFSLTLTLGYGRHSAGRVGNGVGFDLYKIRTSSAPFMDIGASLAPTFTTYPIANTQDHGSMEGRPLVLEADMEEYRKHPEFAAEAVEHPPLRSLWDEHQYDTGNQWGMVIDLNACSGCNACVVACQSENNVPVVGKEQVRNGREMHWIRIDRYYAGDLQDPEMVYQPVACQHCEMAPCEQVCPVQATNHDAEGLNVMVYNRCIGTRYCSNNCPYKVRRFNYFNYTKDLPEIVQMAQNPDVTVRSRGVMEKCTYCIQRIKKAQIDAKNENRELKDGDVVAACQQTCPADAIIFGDILDKESEVYKAKQNNRNYEMLVEFNLKTRTTFLAKLRNPNPEIEQIEVS